jgi:Pyruvate/2-oxoacid:ferredoxin oxidoreductase delta subunit
MCQFCHQHGEGKTWYLQAKNYSEDLLSDVRRRKLIEDFARGHLLEKASRGFAKLLSYPAFIRGIFGRLVTRTLKKDHFGQVVPLEDVEKIFEFTNSIVRTSCLCRGYGGKREQRFCYGLSVAPDGGELGRLLGGGRSGYQAGPDVPRAEKLTKEEALDAFRQHEQEGLCHTIWTFGTPFIGGICNCDRADCMALKTTVTHGVPVMFRGESVAAVDAAKCAGCRECMKACQFGAMGHSASDQKAVIDQRWCYGCGICRSMCRRDAIRLDPRTAAPAAAKLW